MMSSHPEMLEPDSMLWLRLLW